MVLGGMKSLTQILAVALPVILAPSYVLAGGSKQTVELIQFSQTSSTDYLLVVRPRPDIDGYKDYHMGNCEIFTVTGKFREKTLLEGGYIPTRSDHIVAVKLLSSISSSFSLGWMGSGFNVPDPNKPCRVISRALRLFGDNEIISWYQGT